MKRSYWLELSSILLAFVLLLVGAWPLAIAVLVGMTLLLTLILKRVSIGRCSFMAVITFLVIFLIADSGALFSAYAGLEFMTIALSINTAIFYEVLRDNEKLILKPYLFAFVALLIFTIFALVNHDNIMITSAYPLGIFSLLALIDIIFVPYLACMTLSLIASEYNK